MYAIIETGGKQVKAVVGEAIYVEKLDVEEGKTVKFTNVNDANDVVEVDVVANQLDDYYYITLPNIDGEYMISLELKTDNINNESNLKVPEISVYYDEREVLYGCGDLPVLYVDGDVDGNIRWLSQGLVSGTNEYSWIFTPYDSDEYKTVTGTAV